MFNLGKFFIKKDEAKKQDANSKPTRVNTSGNIFAYFKVVVPKHNGICGAEIKFFKVPIIVINNNYHECEVYSTSKPKKELVFIRDLRSLRGIPVTKGYYDSKYKQITSGKQS